MIPRSEGVKRSPAADRITGFRFKPVMTDPLIRRNDKLFVIARSRGDEAIQALFKQIWIASLRSQ